MFPTLILHPVSQFQSFNNGNWKALEGAVSGLQEEPVMLGMQMNVFLGFILATNCQAKQHLR